ncbi:MAG: DNA ligase (NAD(+)) LigA, partial [Sphaerochaetaceae bacterium]|nr:DNA ligase (NAD(+)) LigA [Sphaerochaetaceae bacterium]
MDEIDRIRDEIKHLCDQLKTYQEEYYKKSRSVVSDFEYDLLMDRLIELEKEYPQFALPDSPTLKVGSDLTSSFPEVQHTYPMLSLDKVYTSEGIISWIEKCSKKALKRLTFTVEEKIDGVSLVLYYRNGILDKAVTRGNGLVGNDVTPNARTISSVPLRLSEPVTAAVRGEVFINKEDFLKLNEELEVPFANARNLASGTLRRIKSSETASVPLKMYVYDAYLEDADSSYPTQAEMLDYMKRLGLPVNPDYALIADSQKEMDVTVIGTDDLESYLRQFQERRDALSH